VARRRAFLRPPLDLVELIQRAYSFTCLSLTLPWVTEYLRMMTWSSSFKVANPHKDAISLMFHIYKSKLAIRVDREIVPSNRLYAFIELELFFDWVPSTLCGKLAKALPARSAVFSPIDDQNFAFTLGFLKYVLPELNLVISRLKKGSGMQSAKQTIDISAAVVDIQPKVLKRQTPSLVVSTISPRIIDRPVMYSPSFKSLSGSVSGNALSAHSSPAPSLSRATSYSLSSPSPTFIPKGENHTLGVDQRASDSFWQQHPYLYHVCCFIIEYHNTSCNERLRDKTAEAVREFWNRSADIKNEISLDKSNAISTFQETLTADLKRVYSRLIHEGESFLSEFLEIKITQLLVDLCSLYPCHPRVGKLAAFLIKKQIIERHPKLLEIFGLYSKRKLEEVLTLSTQQVKKQSTQRVQPPASVFRNPSRPANLYERLALQSALSRLRTSFKILPKVVSAQHLELFSTLMSKDCDFEIAISDEELASEIKLLNMVSSIAIDLTELVIAVASMSSFETNVDEIRAGSNIYKLLSVYLRWVRRMKDTKYSCSGFDGMVHIEISKLFSVIFPSLISLDFSCRISFHTNSPQQRPSTIIILADELGLIYFASICRTLATSSKRSILKYFESTRYICNLSVVYLDCVIQFVEHVLREKRVLKLSGYTTGDTEDWLNDPSVRRQVKISISSDFADVITMLSKMKLSGGSSV